MTHFILENRAKQGWDKYIQDEGVLITHVTFVEDKWVNNEVNNSAVQCMTIVPADNKRTSDTNSADLYGETNHEFTSTSTPASKLNMTASGSLASSEGGAGVLDKPVTEIYLNADGTASLWYMKAPVEPLEAPVLAEATEVQATSFTATWSDELTAEHTYTLVVNAKSAVEELLSSTFGTGIQHGWTTGNSTTNSSGYIQLGSRNNTGSVTSPEVTPTSDKLTVSVVAKPYGTDSNVPMKVSLLNGTTTVSSETFMLASAQSTYNKVFDVTANTAYKVKIESTTKQKRVCLVSAVISSGDATAATGAPAKASETGDANSRTITGITEKTYTVEGLTENETFTFKVKAVPVDETLYSESEWSNVQEVTLEAAPVPTLTVEPTSIDFGTIYMGESASQALTITAGDLTGDVTVTLNDNSGAYSVDTETLAAAEADGHAVTVTFAPEAVGQFAATLVFSTPGVDNVEVTLAGIAELEKQVPEMEPVEAEKVTDRTFVASWTAVPNVESYTLQVNKAGAAGAPARAEETGDATSRTVTGITETSYLVAGLDRITTYNYRVKAIYIDGDESDWSNTETVTTKVKTGIDAITAGGRVSLDGNTLTGDDSTRVYTAAGVELPAVDGRLTLAPGVYLIVTPEATAKVIIK